MTVPVSISHISTASILLKVGHLTFITDPVFDPVDSVYPLGNGINLVKTQAAAAALPLSSLPPIDAVLLSHEDHPDNLDTAGRQLLDGRLVFTTPDGHKKLSPRPGVSALQPWETLHPKIGGVEDLSITGTPCVHLPGGEVTGFILASPSLLGTDEASGKPNAIYISGDTIYLPELAQIKEKWNVKLAVLNLGEVQIPDPNGNLIKITLDGDDAVKLAKDVEAEKVIPVHYEGWGHFSKDVNKHKDAVNQGLGDKVQWLVPGVETRIL